MNHPSSLYSNEKVLSLLAPESNKSDEIDHTDKNPIHISSPETSILTNNVLPFVSNPSTVKLSLEPILFANCLSSNGVANDVDNISK